MAIIKPLSPSLSALVRDASVGCAMLVPSDRPSFEGSPVSDSCQRLGPQKDNAKTSCQFSSQVVGESCVNQPRQRLSPAVGTNQRSQLLRQQAVKQQQHRRFCRLQSFQPFPLSDPGRRLTREPFFLGASICFFSRQFWPGVPMVVHRWREQARAPGRWDFLPFPHLRKSHWHGRGRENRVAVVALYRSGADMCGLGELTTLGLVGAAVSARKDRLNHKYLFCMRARV